MKHRDLLAMVLDRHAFLSISNQLIISGTNFAVGIVAARVLGVSEFGLFSVILMISMFIGTVEHTLLTLPMMTLAGNRARRSPSYFASIACLGIAASAIGAVVCVLFIAGYSLLRSEPISLGLMLSGAAMTFFRNVQIRVRLVLFANKKGMFSMRLEALRVSVIFLGGVAIYALGIAVTTPVLFWLFAIASLAAIAPALPQMIAHRVRRDLFRSVLGRHWPIASWILLMLIIGMGQEQAIWVIIGVKLGDQAVGGLRAAQYLLGVSHFVLFALENYMPRRAAEEMRHTGLQGLVRYLSYQSLFLGVASLFVILPIVIFAQPLLALVLGQDYSVYAPIMRIFAIMYLCVIQRTIWIFYLRSVERTRSVFASYIGSSLVAIVTIFPAMHYLGIAGAAWCMTFAQITCLLLIATAVVRHYSANVEIVPKDRNEVLACRNETSSGIIV